MLRSDSIRWAVAVLLASFWAAGGPTAAFAVGGRTPRAAPAAPPVPPVAPRPPVAAIPAWPSAESWRELQSLHEFGGSISPAGWFGIGLQCVCSIHTDDSTDTAVWSFHEQPSIYSVDPDSPAKKAGLEPGDVLTRIDGVPIRSTEGGRRFGAVRPGDAVQWTYERDGKSHTVRLVAQEHPDDPFAAWGPDMQDQLRDAIEKLKQEQQQLHEEQLRWLENGSKWDSRKYYEQAQRDLEKLQRELETSQRSWRRGSGRVASHAPAVVAAPYPPIPPRADARHLRYEGSIAGSDIEVRGSGSVVVTEDQSGEGLLITTPDATIRIRKTK